MSMFAPATKESSKLRLAIYGPSGSGKTFTSLSIAKGIAGDKKIALIDTERRSARKYSDRFKFDVCELDDRSVGGYIKAIKDAGSDYDVIIIDSGSHAWDELLADVERLAQTKFRGNSWSAWSEGTPKQREFIDTILNSPAHILFTMRVDTEWEVSKDERTGKSKPIKIGLKPRQGKYIEYEFDMLMEMNEAHTATIVKDRTSKYQDASIPKPGEDLGKELVAWLSDGVTPAVKVDRPVVANFKRIVKEKNCPQVIDEMLKVFGVTSVEQISDENIGKVINKIQLEEGKMKLDAVIKDVKTNTKDDEVF